jgi:hypothetical protein
MKGVTRVTNAYTFKVCPLASPHSFLCMTHITVRLIVPYLFHLPEKKFTIHTEKYPSGASGKCVQ